MKLIIKLFSEIIVKSKIVRLRFIKILVKNIINSIKIFEIDFKINRFWDKIEIEIKKKSNIEKTFDILKKISGIHSILLVEEFKFSTISEIAKIVFLHYHSAIQNKTFCVRVKRNGKHNFTSIELEKCVGYYLRKKNFSAKVKLKKPDVLINLEIFGETLILIKKKVQGIGGFPIGTQGNVLSLISGGFDSSVSSYMLMNRGCKVHYCFFNVGGNNHLFTVKKIAYHLWFYFGSALSVRFIIIDFRKMIFEILKKIEKSKMGIVFKRMMIRAANKIAEVYNIPALATGEVIGQVSTQTLINMHVINDVANRLILRPIISFDKEDIIAISRRIGTSFYVLDIPEFCSIMSIKPKIKVKKMDIENQEKKIDFSILKHAISNFRSIKIEKLVFNFKNQITKIEIVNKWSENEIILDIRTEEEKRKNPKKFYGANVKSIPFFKLKSEINKLSSKKTYLLYCNHGIMSNLQALNLYEKGFKNIKVYRP